jgi:hypothetical protein
MMPLLSFLAIESIGFLISIMKKNNVSFFLPKLTTNQKH